MYRTVVKRLILPSFSNNMCRSSVLPPMTTISSRFSTDSIPRRFSHQDFSVQQPPPQTAVEETLGSATTSTETAEEAHLHDNQHRHDSQSPREGERRRGVEYQDEQAHVLEAALRHVVRMGWSESAMIAGAKEAGVSPAIIGSFPRKEAALVEFFMDDCLQRLIDRIDAEEDLKNLIHSERIAKLIRLRLEMQAPYITKWPQALSIQALPANVPTSFKQRAMLVDEIWHASGDQASDVDWYLKRTALGGLYSATEIYMLTDNSPDFRDTWAFLGNRVKDVFELGKTVQEAKYLAEAVGAGIGSSLDGFIKGVSRG
ncbi:Ubiquinone biosynthesis protein coq9 protein [Thalictrum thalictroides]|uniref:Ubiquinone biosynthesis protein n=1 Tax=Thalictrum thalictroides TaxID=46969 RepID=A0A7J6V7D7_THATH|nr:Ubiquinone biosynthesis protein coq9 protein [Thalictrum thalictroides]